MNDALKEQYDSLYASTDNVYRAGEPLRELRLLTEYIQAGSVCDVGGGEGINAVYLADLGFEVTVVDFSEVGLQKAKKLAAEQGVHIKTKLQDVTLLDIDERYDVFLFSYLFFHFSNEDTVRVIEKIKVQTKAGGVHLLVTFSNSGALFERARGKGRFYPSETDLQMLYADWEIKKLWSKEVESLARDKIGAPLKNLEVGMLAKKPD